MGEVAVGLPTERATTKDQLVCTDSKRPPVDRVGVSTLGQNLGCHIRHRTRNAGQHPTFGVMNSDVEVGDVSMTALVKEDVVGLQVTTPAWYQHDAIVKRKFSFSSPVNDTMVVEVRKR